MRYSKAALAGVSPHLYLFLADPLLSHALDAGSDLIPLFPDAHPQVASHPFVSGLQSDIPIGIGVAVRPAPIH